ncbi:DNA polymerase III subunit delta [Bacteroidia bacterium]|nr:DNA polymerase III subunit delta [Bacteroidia bacterium]
MATNPTPGNYETLLKELKQKNYKPIYLLMGTEPYFIDSISTYLAQNVLTEEEKAFNLTTLYGNSCDVSQIDSVARRYPMMSQYQVVIVREAQSVKKIEELEKYVSKPLNSTILVLCFNEKKLDKRKALYKNIVKNGVVFESEEFKSYDSNLSTWVSNYVKTQKHCSIDSTTIALVIEALGIDLSKIVSELDRLMMMLPQGTTQITAQHIEFLGISKDFNIFELSNALLQKDAIKAYRIVFYLENLKDFNISSVLSNIGDTFAKLFAFQMLKTKYAPKMPPDVELQEVIGIHPFLVKQNYAPAAGKYTPSKTRQIIEQVRRLDMRSKGWEGTAPNGGDTLRELVGIILH